MTIAMNDRLPHRDGDVRDVRLHPDKHRQRRRHLCIGRKRCVTLCIHLLPFCRTVLVILSMCILGQIDPVFAKTSLGRGERMTLLRSRIETQSSLPEKIELEHELAYLWLGVGCDNPSDTEAFVAETERILRVYKEVGYHYSYLDLQVTYAQLRPAAERETLLWEVITFDPREIQTPAAGNSAKLVNRLKQGAIWAYLNAAAGDAVSAKRDVQASRFREEAEKLSRRLKETEEGRRCLPLVSWWRDTVLADKPMSVPVPVVDAPPPSKWDISVAAPEPDEPATQAVEVADVPSTQPSDWRDKRTYDSVEYIGTVTVAEREFEEYPWLPWGLGGAGVITLAAGLALLWRTRSVRR